MKKILVINTIGLNYEGITNVIYNYLSHMDKSDLEVDVLAFPNTDTALREKFEKIVNVITVPRRKSSVTEYSKALTKVLKNKKYDCVHINGNSATMAIEGFLAKRHKVPKVIVHSHNTTCSRPALNKMLLPFMNKYSDVRLACSKDAGSWLFKNGFTVLDNAIDTGRFAYNENLRTEVRKELGIDESSFVIGHIGHFTEQKNHRFLIDVFENARKIDDNTRLLLVSDGSEFENIKALITQKGLQEYVIMTGRRSDPERLYQAMDIFAFPSKWEGFGLVLLETQASGLSCIVSDRIPKAANITGELKFLAIDDAYVWAKEIAEFEKKGRAFESSKNIKSLKEAGFDINGVAESLKRIYIS